MLFGGFAISSAMHIPLTVSNIELSAGPSSINLLKNHSLSLSLIPVAMSLASICKPTLTSPFLQPYHSLTLKSEPLAKLRFSPLCISTSQPSASAHHPTENGFDEPQSKA